ncbi:MAG TPA: hypothetical protein PKK23_18850 [Nitrospirales bacterium]|nr:hypothetical protein [Nitrospiraceae bacterium]HNP31112.1 hypothetical protein [Nitrospirales bacterium]
MTEESESSVILPNKFSLPDSYDGLAKEFMSRANKLKAETDRLIIQISVLLVVGFLIVIFLPLGLNFLDQFAIGGSAKEWIEAKEAELLEEETKLEQIQKERNELIESINQNIKAPYSLWKMIPTNFSTRNLSTELLKSGTVVVVGNNNDGKPIILRGTTDGTTWNWASAAIESSIFLTVVVFLRSLLPISNS